MDMRNCTNHPAKPVQGVCHSCGKPYCIECLTEDGEYYYCKTERCLPQGFAPKNGARREPQSGPGWAVRAIGVPMVVYGILRFAFAADGTPPGASLNHAQMVGGTIALGFGLISGRAWGWYVAVLLMLIVGGTSLQQVDLQDPSTFVPTALCVLALIIALLDPPWNWAKPEPDLGPTIAKGIIAEKAREERDELRLRAETKELLDTAEKEGGTARAEPEGARIRRRRDSL